MPTIIKDWCLIATRRDGKPITGYTAPEQIKYRLAGTVTGHSRLPDGSDVTTSSLVGKRGENVVTNSGSVYELGPVLEDYAKQFPGAKEKLLNSLPEFP